jgi:L-seryl-tRNA(Ser) seleniumtransferase
MKTVVMEVEARDLSDAEFGSRLRLGTPAVMGRLREGKLVLDLRTVFPHQEPALVEAIRQCLVP